MFHFLYFITECNKNLIQAQAMAICEESRIKSQSAEDKLARWSYLCRGGRRWMDGRC